jgi:hypothetical protein
MSLYDADENPGETKPCSVCGVDRPATWYGRKSLKKATRRCPLCVEFGSPGGCPLLRALTREFGGAADDNSTAVAVLLLPGGVKTRRGMEFLLPNGQPVDAEMVTASAARGKEGEALERYGSYLEKCRFETTNGSKGGTPEASQRCNFKLCVQASVMTYDPYPEEQDRFDVELAGAFKLPSGEGSNTISVCFAKGADVEAEVRAAVQANGDHPRIDVLRAIDDAFQGGEEDADGDVVVPALAFMVEDIARLFEPSRTCHACWSSPRGDESSGDFCTRVIARHHGRVSSGVKSARKA